MQVMKKSLCLLAVIGLTGCTMFHSKPQKPTSSSTYTQAKSVAPVQVPPDLTSHKVINQYPIPAATMPATSQPPAITPPGSSLAKPADAATTTQAVAPTATPPVAPSAFVIMLNYEYALAWDKVGQALRTSGYRILQQDNSLGNYYVLDVVSTGGQLKRNTPIYQVHLRETNNGKTQVSLLNSRNQPADVSTAKRILGAVQQKLAS